MCRSFLILLVLMNFGFSFSELCFAKEAKPKVIDKEPLKNINQVDTSFYSHFPRRKHRLARKAHVWLPAVSYVAPGLAQYFYGQIGAGISYSATGIFGLGVGITTLMDLSADLQDDVSTIGNDDSRIQLVQWGLKTYDLAGSLSAYHAFRTSVKMRQPGGSYAFLGEGEETDELMLAPFEMGYMGRWTTLLPLGVLGAGIVYFLTDDRYEKKGLSFGDGAFAVGISYNAGVGEEALFRGTMLPILTELFDSSLWGNLATAGVFSALHISDANPVPWPQFLLGYYWGWLVERNGWTLSESIFIHTWWDILVFSAALSEGDENASIYIPIVQGEF